MSSILGNAQQGIMQSAADAQEQAFAAASKLKEKKEETSKTIEEGLGSLKVLLGGKGVTKAILDDPIVKKFGDQLKKKAVDAVKKAGSKAIDAVGEKLGGLMPEVSAGASASPAAVQMSSITTDSFVNPAFDAAVPEVTSAEQLAATGSEATVLDTGFAARLFGTAASGEAGLSGVDAAPTVKLTTFGDGDDDFSEFDEEEEEEGAEELGEEGGEEGANIALGSVRTLATFGSHATTAASGVPATTASGADIAGGLAGDTAGATVAAGDLTAAAGAAATGAGGALVGAGAGAGGALAGAAGAGAGAGGDAAVGVGEAILGVLDAIPGVDLFTLAAGAGLAAYAGTRKPIIPKFNPNQSLLQSGSAFQAGFGNV